MRRGKIRPLRGLITEINLRKGAALADILSVTNSTGFVRSLDIFDKQVFSEDSSNYKIVRYDDIAFNPSRVNVGSIARCTFRAGGAVSPMYTVIRCGPELLPEYLLRFLKSSVGLKNVQHRSVGAVRFMLRFSELERIEIPLLSIEEQARAIELLNAAESIKSLRNESDALTEELNLSLFDKYFGDPKINPKNWPLVPLKTISTKFSDGPFGSRLKSEHYTDSGVRVIRLQNIGVGRFLDEGKAFISLDYFKALIKHECLPGDIIVGTLGDPNLRACILPSRFSRALNKADCVQIRCNEDISTREFICWLLNHPSTLSMASGIIAGQTRSRISMGRLADLRIPLPSLPVQREFSDKIQELSKLANEQDLSRKLIESAANAISEKLFGLPN